MQEKQFWGHGPSGFHHIAYTEWGRGSAGSPIICVHGLVRNRHDFDYLSRALEDEGRQVEFPKIGHAPALMDPAQIAIVAEFLRRV